MSKRGIIGRVAQLAQANIGAVIDAAENPHQAGTPDGLWKCAADPFVAKTKAPTTIRPMPTTLAAVSSSCTFTRQSRRKRLQDDDTTAFGADITVPFGIEGPAAAVRRQHRRLAEAYRAQRAQEDVDAARNRHCHLTAPQALAGLVDGDEGGGAGGVDRNARTVEIVDV